MISRSYTWIDESIEHSDEDATKCSMLAKMWSKLATQLENRRFDRMSREENDCGPEFDDDAELSAYELQREMQYEMEQAQLDAIADKLYMLGARMMRPYEHWNEDERYMQYMETRYDNEY